jgi:hypothetical protein
MAIEIIDGCKVYVNGKKLVIINSDCISKCMDVYKKHNLDGVAISIYHDYKIQNVDFFKAYPEIKHISISEGISDISGINGLSALSSAIISGKNKRIDFSFFPKLEVFNADWSPYFKNLDKCVNMYSLSIHHYTPKSKDFADISQLFWLSKLKIVQANISCFHGLEEYNQLEELELNYCGKLEKLGSLEKSTKSLKSLTFDHCKAIKNHNYVTKLKALSTLAFNDCGYLSSIKFIKDLNSLESFIFSNTDVIDGDISPCIGLRYVYFTNKRHFSHKVEEIMSSSSL